MDISGIADFYDFLLLIAVISIPLSIWKILVYMIIALLVMEQE